MARKKTSLNLNMNNTDVCNNLEKADNDLTTKLNTAFSSIIKQQFGSYIAPAPISTPLGIEPIDTLLGGGLFSSAPIRLSSTPETGKSTLAFQFCKQFITHNDNGLIAYIDIEGAGNTAAEQKYRMNRIDTFGIDSTRFQYLPMILDLNGIFEIIQKFCEIKRQVEEAQQKEFYLCIVWDSIAATPSSKIADAESHDSIIGHKARQLTFLLDKYASLFAFNKITFITIDQVRANIKIEGPYAQKEKTVGTFKDYKAASSIAALDHRTSQWMFLSKKKEISLADGLGIDGWYMGIYTEKNKHAPSKIEIEVVFDKSKGIDKFWTEFHFISSLIPTEAKLYKNKKPPFPLLMKNSGAWYYLTVPHPETGEVLYQSDKFYKKDCKHKYKTDPEFQKYFDGAVQMSVYYRIINSLFRYEQGDIDEAHKEDIENEVENEETYSEVEQDETYSEVEQDETYSEVENEENEESEEYGYVTNYNT
ncbi:MAG: hypothetical protein ACOC33_00835 [bacterium]